jgi:voltage-gated potassium channel Kch
MAGAGLLLRRRWAVHTSLFVAVSTILVFAAFGVHVIGGGAFERRTLGALIIRSLFWVAVTIVSMRAMKRAPNSGP